MPARRQLARWLGERPAGLVAAALLLVMAANLFVTVWLKTITTDEIPLIPAGYAHLVAGNFQVNNEVAPLATMWAALPLLAIQPQLPPPLATEENYSNATWAFLSQFWALNAELFSQMIFWPRLMMIAVALALGALVFAYARRLFGPAAAVAAVALYSIEPTLLAHARIVQTDVPSAAGYLACFYALHRYLEAPTWRRVVWPALACAVAILSKFSMLVLLPLLCAFFAGLLAIGPARGYDRAATLRHGGLGALLILAVINAAYYFQHQPLPAADMLWVHQRTPEIAGTVETLFWLGSWLLPPQFLFGIYNQLIHNHFGHPASLLGMQSIRGWWYYFPVAFTLKTTLPFLLLSIGASGWALWRLAVRRDTRMALPLLAIFLFFGLTMNSHINIGVRYLLPALPFLCILGGALLVRLFETAGRFRVAARAAVVLAFCLMVVEAVRTFPNYIPYMNQLAQPRPHYWYLSDSNVEWGDDVDALARYLRERGETKVRGALLGGWMTLRFYGVDQINMLVPPGTPVEHTKYVALGASFMNGSTVLDMEGVPEEQRTELFAAYRDRVPEAIIGGSIYVFRDEP